MSAQVRGAEGQGRRHAGGPVAASMISSTSTPATRRLFTQVKEMMKMKGQMESAVKDYDSSVPRMKAKLPAMKEVRDKKAKKDKFVAQNKARREKKERDAKAAQKKVRAPRPPVPYAIDALHSRRPRTRNAPTRRRGKKKRRSRRRPTRRRKRSRAVARAGRRSRGCFNYTLFNKTNTRRSPRAPPRAFQRATPRRCARARFSAAASRRAPLKPA